MLLPDNGKLGNYKVKESSRTPSSSTSSSSPKRKRWTVYRQLLRFNIICSKERGFNKLEMKRWFLKRKHLENIIENEIKFSKTIMKKVNTRKYTLRIMYRPLILKSFWKDSEPKPLYGEYDSWDKAFCRGYSFL